MYEFIGCRIDSFGNEIYRVKHKPLIPFLFKEKEIEYLYTKKVYSDSGEYVFYSLGDFEIVSYHSHLTKYLTKMKRKLMFEQTGIVLN